MVLHYYNHTLWYGSILVYALLYSIIANSYYVLIIFVHKYWIYWQKFTLNVGILKKLRYSQSIFFSRQLARKITESDIATGRCCSWMVEAVGRLATSWNLKYHQNIPNVKNSFREVGPINIPIQFSGPQYTLQYYLLLEIFSSVNSSKSFQRYI